MKITYGVRGLVEYTASLPAGRARIDIHFSGGAMTKYGVTPAEFETADLWLQRLIENSEQFKHGKIVRLR